jgi:Tfp pilus assembly protein PilF
VADFGRAIRLDPTFADAYLARAAVYEQMGQFDLAQADRAEAKRRDPTLTE